MLPDVDHISSIFQLAATVEAILDQRGCNRHSETWGDAAARLFNQDPEGPG